MNDVVGHSAEAAFESASELRDKHARLLDEFDRQLGQDASATAETAALSRMEPAIREFLERGAATGVYLDEVKERTACQVLLDYWVSNLAQAAIGAPSARLAPFDGDKLPDLKDKPCPYVGLDAFRSHDFFFGRESDTKALLEQIRRTPLVVVLGASGSGKSSLVMGGVLPALADPKAVPAVRVAPTIVPGNAVLTHLTEAVLQASGGAPGDAAAAAAKVKTDPGHLSAMAGGADAPAMVITIDQFEEVFTLADSEQREALAAGIAALVAADRGHRVILTMREEFRSRLVELRALGHLLDKAWYSMRPMGYEELKAAVERPAMLVNLQFQSGIVDDLVKRVLGQPAALPLLQFTLRSLWDRRDRNRITWEVYRKVGDPLTALAASADEFYDALAPESQREARRILLELVRVDELLEAYRQPVPKSRLLRAGKANTEDVLQVLVENDFVRVTADDDGEDAIVEVKHESLIRNWPRLVTWIDEKRIERRQRIALTQATERWARSGKPTEGLLTGWQLEEAKRQPDLSPIEREFVEASAEQVDRVQQEQVEALRREAAVQRRWIAAIVVVAALAVFAAVVAYQNWTDASRAQAVAESRLLGRTVIDAVDVARQGSAGEGLAQAADLMRKNPDSESARSLTLDLLLHTTWPLPVAETRRPERAVWAAFGPEDDLAVTRWENGAARLWRTDTGETVAELDLDGPVQSVGFSPDGRFVVAAASFDGADVWDTRSGKRVARLPKPGTEMAEFDRTGRYLLTGSTDGSASVWAVPSWAPVATVHLESTTPLFAAHFSHDSRTFLTASATGFRIWAVTTGQAVTAMVAPEERLYDVASSPDGRWIATAGIGDDGPVVRVWTAGDAPGPVARLEQRHATRSLQFSDDGTALLTTDGLFVRIWDIGHLPDAEVLPNLELRHRGTVNSASFGTNAAHVPYVVTASGDGLARVWDASTGRQAFASMTHSKPVSWAQFDREARRIVTAADNGASVAWRFESGPARPLKLNAGASVVSVAFSPDGSQIIAGTQDATAHIWNAGSGEQEGLLTPGFTRDSGLLVEAAAGNRLLLVKDFTAYLWTRDGDTWTEEARSEMPAFIFSGRFDPTGTRVVAACGDGSVSVWNTADGTTLTFPERHEADALYAEFSPDGRYVVSASRDKTARVWDAATGQPVGQPFRHDAEVFSARFSSAGTRVVTAAADGKAVIWNVGGGEAAPALEHTGPVVWTEFSPDDRRVFTAAEDGTLRIWDAAAGELLARQLVHGARISAGSLSRDGRRVVTGSSDGTVRISDTATGLPLSIEISVGSPVTGVRFDPSGTRVVVGSEDQAVLVFELAKVEPADTAWLASFAERIGGMRLSAAGAPVPLDDWLSEIAGLREKARRSDSRPPTTLEQRVEQWFFAPPATRPASPFAAK